MKDWTERLDVFLKFSEYDILHNPENVSHEVAQTLAHEEYEKYRVIQDREYISDFDREVKILNKTANGKVTESV